MTHWKFGGHRVTCKETPDDARGTSNMLGVSIVLIFSFRLGWDKRDRKFSEFITMFDVNRHSTSLHRLAAKRNCLPSVSSDRSTSLPYGCSVDYRTVPPTLDVFRVEKDDRGKDIVEAYYQRSGMTRSTSLQLGGRFYKIILPKGNLSLKQILHGADEYQHSDYVARGLEELGSLSRRSS